VLRRIFERKGRKQHESGEKFIMRSLIFLNSSADIIKLSNEGG
jgi:hypothetical protein